VHEAVLRVQQYGTTLNSVDELRQFVEEKRLSLLGTLNQT